MKKPTRYILTAMSLSCVLAGCSSGWSMTEFRDRLKIGGKPKSSDVSVVELQSRAAQLEKIREFEMAEELYAEILKKEHDHKLAQERLTALQHLKRGLPPHQNNPKPIRERIPQNRERSQIARGQKDLPKITPGKQEDRPAIVATRQPTPKKSPSSQSFSLREFQDSGETPEWVSGTESTNQTIARDEKFVSAIIPREVTPEFVEDVNTKRDKNRETDTYEESTVRTVPVTKIVPANWKTQNISDENNRQRYQTMPIDDLLDVLARDNTDEYAIEEVIAKIPEADRSELWRISSTLEVLMNEPYARTVILSRLSTTMASSDPDVRERTLLMIGGLGQQAAELMPLVRLRLSDESESVRRIAGVVIDEMQP